MRKLVAVVVLLLTGTAAFAENRVVTFENKSDSAVEALFGSNVGENSWEEDLLGEGVLEPGEAIEVNFDDGTGSCQFDFKATFADGTEGTLADVNVCEVSNVTIG